MPKKNCKALPLSKKVYIRIGKYIVYIVLSMVSGVYWVSWDVSPMDKGNNFNSCCSDTKYNHKYI